MVVTVRIPGVLRDERGECAGMSTYTWTGRSAVASKAWARP